MNLTSELKDKVERAETMEEKKNIIADAGMELTDEELEGVAGGNLLGNMMSVGSRRIPFICKDSNCRATMYIQPEWSTIMCPKCHRTYNLNG